MLIVGRGGEGVVLASQLLADTFGRAGYWVQSFPEFKAERRGAPISAFLRWDESAPIHRRYKVQDCDVLVVVSPAPPSEQLLAGVRPGGLVLLNREHPLPVRRRLRRRSRSRRRGSRRSTASSRRKGGRWATWPCSARASSCSLPHGLGFLEEAIAARMGVHGRGERRRRRARATRAARASTCSRTMRESSGPRRSRGIAAAAARSSPSARATRSRNHTGSWSLDRPVLLEACNACARVRALLPGGGDHAHRRLDGRSTTSTARAAASARSSAPYRTRSRWKRCRDERDAPARTLGDDRERGGRVRGDARPRPGDRLLPDHAADADRRAAGRARRGPRRRRVREPRERALDVRLRRSPPRVPASARSRRRRRKGLLYAHEQLHRASRERVPLVVVNVNRAVFAPWSIEPDLSDSMSQRDTGWIQLYCSSAQEVLDSILCAYRIAETALLPVMVCAEGFLLSHTSEVLDIPDQETVDAFIPELRPPDGLGARPGQPAHVLGAARAERLLRVPAQRRRGDGRRART